MKNVAHLKRCKFSLFFFFIWLVVVDSIASRIFPERLAPLQPCKFQHRIGSEKIEDHKQIPLVAKLNEARKSKTHQIVTFLSGGIAGTVASTLTMPLEVIKTQLQSSSGGINKDPIMIFQKIWRNDGPIGFFRGLRPMLIGIIPTRAIYFWAYSTSKDFLKRTNLGDSPINHLLSAFAAGITSNTITNPIWMVKTRFQIIGDHQMGQKVYSRYREVIQAIWQEEGLHGFFKGLTASYIGCFEGAIQWIVYEKLKNTVLTSSIMQSFQQSGQKRKMVIQTETGEKIVIKPSVLDLFLMAAFSKFTAICLTYPHEVVRTRLREQSINGIFKYSGFFNAFRKIAVEEGAKGLYSGLGMHLIRSVPNAAIMFVSYELVSTWLEKKATRPVLVNPLGSNKHKQSTVVV